MTALNAMKVDFPNNDFSPYTEAHLMLQFVKHEIVVRVELHADGWWKLFSENCSSPTLWRYIREETDMLQTFRTKLLRGIEDTLETLKEKELDLKRLDNFYGDTYET